MRLTIRLRPAAKRDLVQIYQWTLRKFGMEQAEKYISGLSASVEFMAGNHELARDADDIRRGLLKYPFGSHMIFFRISGNVLTVSRFLHQRMDAGRWM